MVQKLAFIFLEERASAKKQFLAFPPIFWQLLSTDISLIVVGANKDIFAPEVLNLLSDKGLQLKEPVESTPLMAKRMYVLQDASYYISSDKWIARQANEQAIFSSAVTVFKQKIAAFFFSDYQNINLHTTAINCFASAGTFVGVVKNLFNSFAPLNNKILNKNIYSLALPALVPLAHNHFKQVIVKQTTNKPTITPAATLKNDFNALNALAVAQQLPLCLFVNKHGNIIHATGGAHINIQLPNTHTQAVPLTDLKPKALSDTLLLLFPQVQHSTTKSAPLVSYLRLTDAPNTKRLQRVKIKAEKLFRPTDSFKELVQFTISTSAVNTLQLVKDTTGNIATTTNTLAASGALCTYTDELPATNPAYWQQLQNDYYNLLLGSNEGVVFINNDLKIRNFTQQAAELLQLDISMLNGNTAAIQDVLQYDTLREDLEAVMQHAHIIQHQFLVADSNKEYNTHILVSLLPYFNTKQEVNGLMMVLRDISQEYIVQNRLNSMLASLQEESIKHTHTIVKLRQEIEKNKDITNNLSVQRNLLAAVFQAMHEGVVVTNTKGVVQWCNNAATQILSVTEGDSVLNWLKAHQSSFLNPQSEDVIPYEQNPIHKAIIDRQAVPKPVLLRSPNGAKADIYININTSEIEPPLQYTDGITEKWAVIILNDITYSKEIELQLLDEKATTQALLGAIPDEMFRLDRSGKYIDYFPTKHGNASNLADAFIDNNLADVLNKDVAQNALLKLHEALTEDSTTAYQFDWYWQEQDRHSIYELRFSRINKQQALCMLREVTQAIVAREAYQKAANFHKDLTLKNPAPIVLFNREYIITQVNAATVKLLEADTQEQLIGTNVLDYIPLNKYKMLAKDQIKIGFEDKMSNEAFCFELETFKGNIKAVAAIGAVTTIQKKRAIHILLHDLSLLQDYYLYTQQLHHTLQHTLALLPGKALVLQAVKAFDAAALQFKTPLRVLHINQALQNMLNDNVTEQIQADKISTADIAHPRLELLQEFNEDDDEAFEALLNDEQKASNDLSHSNDWNDEDDTIIDYQQQLLSNDFTKVKKTTDFLDISNILQPDISQANAATADLIPLLKAVSLLQQRLTQITTSANNSFTFRWIFKDVNGGKHNLQLLAQPIANAKLNTWLLTSVEAT